MANKKGKEQQALHLVTIPITYATSEYMQQIVMPDSSHQQISKHWKKSEFKARLILEVISKRVKWFWATMAPKLHIKSYSNLTIGDDGGSSVKEVLVMANKSGKEQKALHLVTIPITYATATSEYMQQIVLADKSSADF